MIDKLRRLVLGAGSTPDEPDTGGSNDFETAAAALLVEAASIDDNFDDAEYATIARLLAERFDLSSEGVRTLIEDAHDAAEQSVELFSFARRVKAGFDHEERVIMIEMLWEVVYADGIVHDYEANLVRRITGLLHVTDRESGEARKCVLAKLDG